MHTDSYFKKFDFYMALLSASTAGIVAIAVADKEILTGEIVFFILCAVLAIGLITFSTMTTTTINVLDGNKRIQFIREFMIENYPGKVCEFLKYWDQNKDKATTSTKRLIFRGLFRTSPKTVVVIINSAIISYLGISTIPNFFIGNDPYYKFGLSLIFFVCSLLVHLLYGRVIYKINGY